MLTPLFAIFISMLTTLIISFYAIAAMLMLIDY